MAVTLATFRARFPEFGTFVKPVIGDTAVQACIDEAEATIDRTVMDASAGNPKGDTVVGLRAAAALRSMQGDKAAGPAAVYEAQAERLARGAASAYRVI